ncbi:MAG: Gfo/Idh/MocA family oxidoreductase [Chloroflexota bacterium]
MTQRKRYAIVGTGGRAGMFVRAITKTYPHFGELVALSDLSQTRMDWYNEQLVEQLDMVPVPTYHSDNFDQMVAETKPDVIIVTTMDSTHHQYIIRAMELGCDAISEKPMTTDAEKANAIFDAIERTGKSLRVSFNYRYANISTTVRDLIVKDTIGKLTSVHFEWVLDTKHGADYFRRWHREKDKSGGLMVHKATHHFDLINWWVDSYPAEVFAFGNLAFYGRENAEARGESYNYDRYTGEGNAANDPFALDLNDREDYQGLYLEAEKDTGYVRDRNVFGDNVTIEDTMSVTARYRNGVLLTYSLHAYCPWEGYRIAINGTKGRLEVELFESVGKHFRPGETPDDYDPEAVWNQFGHMRIRVYPMFGLPYDAEIPQAKGGGHGGADPIMLEQIFDPNAPADPYDRAASHVDGAASILLGISANKSMETGQMVKVDDLLKLP